MDDSDAIIGQAKRIVGTSRNLAQTVYPNGARGGCCALLLDRLARALRRNDGGDQCLTLSAFTQERRDQKTRRRRCSTRWATSTSCLAKFDRAS